MNTVYSKKFIQPAGRTLNRYELTYKTVTDILASRLVTQFCIGITGNPTQRRSAYSRWAKMYGAQIKGFALLDWDLGPDAAANFEEWLFYQTKKSRKYGNSRFVGYFRNVNRNFSSQSIYMAWWEPVIYLDDGTMVPKQPRQIK